MPPATISRPLLATLLLAALAGCSSPRSSPGHKLTWRTLSRGLSSGLVQPGHHVIRDPTAYFKLWADHAAEVPRAALPPAVDFSREMVVAVALGQRPTGGYMVEIVDVVLRGRTARVLVAERVPRPGVLQIQMATQPYQFIALPALNARIEFRNVDPADAPRSPRKARPGEDGYEAPPPPRRQPPSEPLLTPRGSPPPS
jgi:hypothetical protein